MNGPQNASNDRLRGIVYMSISVIGFSIMQGLVKYLGPGVTGWTKAFYRSVFGLVFLIAWKIGKRSGFRITNIPLLILRGVVGGISLSFSFWAIDLLDLSRSTLYLYIYPIFAPLFSALIFREKLRPRMIIPLCISCAGVVLVSNISSLAVSFGDIIGLGSGIIAGVAIATVRELRKSDTPEDIYLGFLLVSLVVCGIGVTVVPGQSWVIPLDAHLPIGAVWAILIVIGGTATIGQLSMTYSYRVLPTSVGGVIGLLAMPCITLIAIFFFNEPFRITTIIGGILIFGSAILSSILSGMETD
jgi:drug/metabolite transporter (DMT)-like permease